MNTYKKCRKSAEKFNCNYCDYTTSHKSHYEKHILTIKHQNNQNTYTNLQKCDKSAEIYLCDCGNKYIHRQSLWNHKKKCDFFEKSIKENNDKEKLVIMTLHQSIKGMFDQVINL